ncbi:AraC family transcriptional regulator [Arthrobacter sulfonylureivorans]|uniref:AraC family transcriptional regulator n=1 Tax=Arthrobacter sulfonylureivorans TaxID=2486855 RepID=A0ABY3WBR0_9MICC|nr:AraC family transcriptional regulator [Arthrobacter sulfonylureivorans]UNK47760.1 AraC family transcriptional regulator [Arthrobacter sulfonylureivorans]
MSTLLASAPIRMTESLDTASWAAALGDVLLPVDVTGFGAGASAATIVSSLLGDIRLSVVDAPSHTVHRHLGHIAADVRREAVVCYQLSGVVCLEQGGIETIVQPGEFTIFDWEASFTLTAAQGYRAVILQLPVNAILIPFEAFRKKVSPGIRPTVGLGLAVSPFFTKLAENAGQLHGWAGERVVRSAVELACAVFAEHVRSAESAPSCSPDFVKAAAYAEANLIDPDLDARRIAAAIFVSTRQLHKIFQAEGTTASAWIRARRLAKCRSMLNDPEYHWMSVGDIGAAWGFFNRAHFSRIYRAAYGCSPREHRGGCLE